MKPLRPAFRTSCRFMPKPRATTQTWSRILADVRAAAAYGCVKHKPNRIPMVRATGGERSPVNERMSARKKRIFARAGITKRKSMRAGANVSNCESARGREIHPHFCRVFRGRAYSTSPGREGAGGGFSGADEFG